MLNPNFDISYDNSMVSELNQELVAAFLAAGDSELEVVDPVTQRVYVQVDCETHREAMDALRRQQDRNAIGEGLKQMQSGGGKPLDQAFSEMRARLGFPRHE